VITIGGGASAAVFLYLCLEWYPHELGPCTRAFPHGSTDHPQVREITWY